MIASQSGLMACDGMHEQSESPAHPSYPDTSAVQAMCGRYTQADGVGLENLSIVYWQESTPGSEEMSPTAGGGYALASVFAHGSVVVFSLSATKDGQSYYPFDTCDYPGSYCSGQGDECVLSVGSFQWTLGDCAGNGARLWTSDEMRDAPAWTDNPDALGMCTANGIMTIP